MAIDPAIATAGAKLAGDIVNETGKTYRENKKSEEETKQKVREEKEKTKRNKDGKEAEIVQKEIDKDAETKQKAIEKEAEIDHKTIEKEAETEQKKNEGERKTIKDSMDIVNKSSEKITNKLNDIIKDVKDEYREHQKETDKKLVSKDNEIKEYQKSLMSAYGEVQRYKAVEEASRIISDNIIAFVDKKAKFDETIKNISYDIGEKKKELQPLEIDLNTIKTDIKSLKDSYMELGYKFEIVVKAMSELKYEHKHDFKPKKYNEKYNRKKRELKELINDTSNKERQLLEKEKERLVKIEAVEPLLIEMKKAKKVKALLENNRERILTTELHKIGNLQLGNKNTDMLGARDVIDVSIDEESKSDKLLT